MEKGEAKPRRITERGVTLIEVLVVVAILSLISGAIGMAVFERWKEARKETAVTNLRTLRELARMWQLRNGEAECPTIAHLLKDRLVDDTAVAKDPWGSEYRIVCSDDLVRAVSAGPDRKEGTTDDLMVPENRLTQ